MTQYRRAFIAGATWFFTVNLAHRRSMLLTERIDDLREAVRQVRSRHPFAIEAMVVLPDMHTINETVQPSLTGLPHDALNPGAEALKKLQATMR